MLVLQANVEIAPIRPRVPFDAVNSALRCVDDLRSSRFHAWHGCSGQRYVMSVFGLDHAAPGAGLPDLGEAVLVAVRRQGEARVILGVAAIERASDWSRAIIGFHDSAQWKPDEWHVHLLARDRTARNTIVADLSPSQKCAVVV